MSKDSMTKDGTRDAESGGKRVTTRKKVGRSRSSKMVGSIPLGSSVNALSIRCASRAFLTESSLLRIRSRGIRRMSLI